MGVAVGSLLRRSRRCCRRCSCGRCWRRRCRRCRCWRWVAVGVGVGVGLIVLAVCMAIISLSDNARIPNRGVLDATLSVSQSFRCIACASRLVRLHVLPVASVAVVEATLVPSTNRFERSCVAPECNRMPASVERRSTGKATCHDGCYCLGLEQ